MARKTKQQLADEAEAERKKQTRAKINKVIPVKLTARMLDWQPGNGTRYEFVAFVRPADLCWYVALINFNTQFVRVPFGDQEEIELAAAEIGFREHDGHSRRACGPVDKKAIADGLRALILNLGS